MYVVLIVLGVLALGEGGAIWYVWSKWRAARTDVTRANDLAAGTADALAVAYQKLTEARAALAVHNQVEARNDVQAVATAPDLTTAISRINGLLPADSGPGPAAAKV